ncbi:SDR family oxidoreductase [Rhizobium ruizarguesonis]|jgi:NAD(P)-dependent dehydrogenase (short-subunit alcohol dehydrogenase family)|uniref:SDR family oxidoreductase n=1 Tax=Rhizobium ruizarguesonis TaxID=2081791 RepID=UPI00102FBB30|nr:SDR family oxidoreductase [Rhizobium ruizarguesonis]MBY5886389.1 SDR family oxidoreductase [Rhizobium leguminosarum]QSZ01823.1 SDR family oxidoreductase [Rhizobium ruizarguesonis]TAT87173.1 SDR family oxidoreductase [Rhizobium ruizarguesonis]TAZ38442.1 SDR family oxidoreductase [Rhizobium ruizarguesonis]TAZ82219.1 SDR family oxidoreductase [Rhizobium ruizarguesonis]
MNVDGLFDVSGDVVLVTGVSGQLGGEYAKAFLARNARVVGLDLRPSAGSLAMQDEYPDNFMFCSADVTKKASLEQALQDVTGRFGTPTVLINNAAIDSPPSAPPEENGPFEDYPEASWDKVIDVNLKGVYLSCQVFGAAMANAGKGSIINVASIYGLVSPDQSLYEYRRKRGEVFFKPVAYSASKSGILNLTRYLATYWAKRNVRVNSLTIAGVFNNQEQDFLDVYCSRIPIGRMASVDEYNGAMLFLASPASRYMTGSNLIIDGGWTAI